MKSLAIALTTVVAALSAGATTSAEGVSAEE